MARVKRNIKRELYVEPNRFQKGVKLKRLTLLIGIALLCTGLYAAAPDQNTELHQLADQEIDSQWTGTWEYIDSIIVVITDTGYSLCTISGVAALNPGEKLYVGLLNGGGDPTTAASDTLVVACDITQRGMVKMPFTFSIKDSTINQNDVTDTVYVTAAVGGSTAGEKVTIENMWFELRIIDTDDQTGS